MQNNVYIENYVHEAKKKNTLVPGNAGEEKDFHTSDRKFIF